MNNDMKYEDLKSIFTNNFSLSTLGSDFSSRVGLISLICYLGLRISDVINLRLSNIDFNNNIISIIQYKTDNKLVLPLIDKVKYPLLDYLKSVRPNDTALDFIFITNTKPYVQNIKLKTHKAEGIMPSAFFTHSNGFSYYIAEWIIISANISMPIISANKPVNAAYTHSFLTISLSVIPENFK